LQHNQEATLVAGKARIAVQFQNGLEACGEMTMQELGCLYPNLSILEQDKDQVYPA
jgi:hypothetical protein